MRTEEQSKSDQRYLFAYEYFSDEAIAIWQSECIKRLQEKQKGDAYERFISWKRAENEIAVFTLYAYADFSIPKRFDTIFYLKNPSEFIRINYELIQSIHEAWLPLDTVDHGHKHLCVFSFENEVPQMLYTLHNEHKKFSTSPKGQKGLGFCNSDDFEAIKNRIEKTFKLKEQYGEEWWKYDHEE